MLIPELPITFRTGDLVCDKWSTNTLGYVIGFETSFAPNRTSKLEPGIILSIFGYYHDPDPKIIRIWAKDCKLLK